MLIPMPSVSHTAEGFRAAFRHPSLTLAEICWRWTVGLTAGALLTFALIEYLNSLPVTDRERLFLRTKLPSVVGRVMAHILRGSLNRIVLASLVLALAFAALWTVAASIGRAVTVSDLLDYFASRAGAVKTASAKTFSKSPVRGLLFINFLRATLVLAGICGFLGAAIVANLASPAKDPRPTLAFFLFVLLAGLVSWFCWDLNWFLSLAGIFAIRNRENAIDAISSAVALCRERTGSVFAVSAWTGLAHMGIFVIATTLVSISLSLFVVVPWRLMLAGITLLTLIYFAVADWLYMARLAGYVSILEMPETVAAPAPISALPTVPARRDPTPPLAATIDFDEPILSDVPPRPSAL
jgi:hypothetical protein